MRRRHACAEKQNQSAHRHSITLPMCEDELETFVGAIASVANWPA